MTGIFKGIQSMISTVQSIVDGIVIGIKFLINLVKSIGQLIQLLITTLANTTNIILTLPSWLIAFATATLGVAILYMVLGRQTGK